MIKRLLLIFSIIVLSINKQAVAQIAHYALGINAGPSYNFLYGSKDVQGGRKPVYLFSAGLSYQYNFNSRFSIATGLSYDLKGENQYTDFTDAAGKVVSQFKFKRRFSYLVIPLQGKVYFGEKLKFFLNAGGYAGVALNHTGTVEVEDKLVERTLLLEYTRPLDIGLIAGAGFELPVSSALDLSLELRNSLSVSDWRKKAYTTEEQLHVNSLSLLAGLSYKFE